MILWRNTENYPFFIILIPTPDFPYFYYMLGGNLRSLLYGDVSVMRAHCDMSICTFPPFSFLFSVENLVSYCKISCALTIF